MNLLLDTQIVLWWLSDSPELSGDVRKTLTTAGVKAHVSKASLWEIVIKGSLGKLRGDVNRIAHEIENNGFQWLDIGIEHLLKLGELNNYKDHKDPFDRLLVAQSLTEPMILLTTDAKLARYGPTVRIV